MKKDELLSAIQFGKDVIADFKRRNEPVPVFVYERIIELQDKLIAMSNQQ